MKAFKAIDFKKIKDECKKVVRQSFDKHIPTEVNYDDIKSHLLALENCQDLESWIIFKVTIQQKIKKTREVIKSIPELKEKWMAFHQAKKDSKRDHKREHHHHGKWQFWKKFKNKCRNKKKEWFKNKFQSKVDKSIQLALPQIALQVAEILKNDQFDEMKLEAPKTEMKAEFGQG